MEDATMLPSFFWKVFEIAKFASFFLFRRSHHGQWCNVSPGSEPSFGENPAGAQKGCGQADTITSTERQEDTGYKGTNAGKDMFHFEKESGI